MSEQELTPEESRQIGWAIFDLAIASGDVVNARACTEQLGEPMPVKRIELMVRARREKDPETRDCLWEEFTRIPVVERPEMTQQPA